MEHIYGEFLNSNCEVSSLQFRDDGSIPNNALPLLFYQDALLSACADIGRAFESILASNDWPAAWRWGVYDYHHYHSTTHEFLGCLSGQAKILFGGDAGESVAIKPGDAVVIPAGVGHKKLSSSADFLVLGAYPKGCDWDMNYGKPEERENALPNISLVPVPCSDPLLGANGPLTAVWR